MLFKKLISLKIKARDLFCYIVDHKLDFNKFNLKDFLLTNANNMNS